MIFICSVLFHYFFCRGSAAAGILEPTVSARATRAPGRTGNARTRQREEVAPRGGAPKLFWLPFAAAPDHPAPAPVIMAHAKRRLRGGEQRLTNWRHPVELRRPPARIGEPPPTCVSCS